MYKNKIKAEEVNSKVVEGGGGGFGGMGGGKDVGIVEE